jgi:hypothetical protein
MTFDDELEKGIAEIIGGLRCPKDFRCYRSGFENLCKAKDFGNRYLLECLEETPEQCKFSVVAGVHVSAIARSVSTSPRS